MNLVMRRGISVMLIAMATAGPTMAAHTQEQQVNTPEIAVVREFLDGIQKHDLSAQLSHLTPDAQAYRYRDGKLVVSRIGDVLRSMAKGNGSLSTADASKSASEPIDEVGSKVFDRIATVWARYRFIVEGKVHHCGHTVYSLVKQDDRWLIANVIDEATKICT
jgi:hypothetical protein